MSTQGNISPKLIVLGVLTIAAILIIVSMANNLVETVEKGTYHIKQAAITGELTAKMKPGMYGQFWGDITIWPIAETFYFTADSEEGESRNQSISVRFNDGSKANISGTCRVNMPRSEQEAISLISDFGYQNYVAVQSKLILPTIRKALIVTANLMSAKESYSERRADYYSMAWDQIENGVYKTKDETKKEMDPVSGKEVTRTYKVILTDDKGNIMREKNPLDGTGITLANFEVKHFMYEDRVQMQIREQQEAYMAVQTALAKAKEAEQQALTVEAQGKAAVMKAKYIEEQEKVKAEVRAEKDKLIATIEAQKKVDVAEKNKEEALVQANKNKEVAAIELEAARLEKQRQIELGTGESERKRLVLAADGALEQKLEAWVASQKVWADAYATRKVPTMVVQGGDGTGTTPGADQDAAIFMKMMGLKAMKDLAVDMEIKSGTTTGNATTK